MTITNSLIGRLEQEAYRVASEIYSDITRFKFPGGMSHLFTGFDHWNRKCMIKIPLESEFKVQPDAIEFEADITSKLSSHPNTSDFVAFHSPGILVTKFEDAPDLHTRIYEGDSLSHDDMEGILLKIGSAIKYVHSFGIVHGDIKPTNIIYGNEPKLIDFGIAGTLMIKAGRTGAPGTKKYIAPESVLRGDYSGDIDYYGLAVTLIEALCDLDEYHLVHGIYFKPEYLQALINRTRLPTNLKKRLLLLADADPSKRKEALGH